MFGPPIDPPDPCEHDENPRWCEECEADRSYGEDMLAEWQMERRRLGD